MSRNRQMAIEVPIPSELLDLVTRMDNIETMVMQLLKSTGKSVVTIKDIAEMEGVPANSLRAGGENRYLLPFFGASEYPSERQAKWKIETYLMWREQDPKERQRAYLNQLMEETKKMVDKGNKETEYNVSSRKKRSV